LGFGGPQNYVQPVAARIDKEPNSGMDVISFEVVPDNYFLAKDEKGHWITGIQLTLDAPPRKFLYYYPIWFILSESVCEMVIGLEKQKFTFPIEDAAKYKPAFDHMVTLVKNRLALKPWEETTEDKKIGFVHLPPL
jgi:hypothetical protein